MTNPYASPEAAMSDFSTEDETYEPKIFSTQGRIGRLRYLGYSSFVSFVMLIVIGIVAAVLIPALSHKSGTGHGSDGPAVALVGLMYIPLLAIAFIMAKRRLNDLDHSGWLSLLLIVPFVNFFMGLYLTFFPGTPGANSYGPKPVKNSWLIIVAFILPIPMIGILAAIALPAYQQYTVRAKAAQAAHAAPAPVNFDQGQ